MTEEELNTQFDFSKDEKKKEDHWKRDKNLQVKNYFPKVSIRRQWVV